MASFTAGDRVSRFSECRFSAHAEFLLIPGDGALAVIPANSAFEQAAPSTEDSHHALSFIWSVKVRSGQRVLINGATSATSSAAVPRVSSHGASVTAACGTGNAGLARSLVR